MRKIIVFNMLSVDGFFAGVDGNLDWHNVDDEFNKFAIKQMREFHTILFGRTTYQMFESFWPVALKDPNTSEDNRKVAQIINDIEKIVFSSTLEKVTWNNSKILKNIDSEEIKKTGLPQEDKTHEISNYEDSSLIKNLNRGVTWTHVVGGIIILLVISFWIRNSMI